MTDIKSNCRERDNELVTLKPVSVNLDADDYREFQILCLRRGVKVSAALRDFIRRELSSEREAAAAAQSETSHSC